MPQNLWKQWRAASGLAAAVVSVGAVACSDWTAPRMDRTGTSFQSDYIAAGSVFNAIWMPGPKGLELKGSASGAVELSSTNRIIHTSAGAIAPIAVDVGAARLLRTSMSADFQTGNSVIVGGVPRVTLKARTVARQRIGDNDVRVAFVPDAEAYSGRPPKAILIFVNDRVSAIMESQYARRGGSWRPTRTRTTMLDTTGKVSLVSDTDLGGLSFQSGVAQSTTTRNLRERFARAIPNLVRMVQPDVLNAATVDDIGLPCAYEAAAVASAGFWVVAAASGIILAQAGVDAAALAFDAAMLACETIPTCLAAYTAAVAVEKLAQTALTSANSNVVAAGIAAAAAGTALTTCMDNLWKPKKPDETYSGINAGGASTGGGGEEWCQWTVSFDDYGDIFSVTTDFCWVQ
jgi:hypothetical protein